MNAPLSNRQRVEAMCLRGLSTNQIADLMPHLSFGTVESYVRAWYRRTGTKAPPRGHRVWTAERTEKAKTMWIVGYSASHIAATLGNGISRAAVISKMHRMGIVHLSSPSTRECNKISPDHRPPLPEAVKLATLPGDAAPDSLFITLLELKFDSCRYPLGDARDDSLRYCGAKAPGFGIDCYCAYHKSLCYRTSNRSANKWALRWIKL